MLQPLRFHLHARAALVVEGGGSVAEVYAVDAGIAAAVSCKISAMGNEEYSFQLFVVVLNICSV